MDRITSVAVPQASSPTIIAVQAIVLGLPANRHTDATVILHQIDRLCEALDQFAEDFPADPVADDCVGSGWGLRQLRGAVDASL